MPWSGLLGVSISLSIAFTLGVTISVVCGVWCAESWPNGAKHNLEVMILFKKD